MYLCIHSCNNIQIKIKPKLPLGTIRPKGNLRFHSSHLSHVQALMKFPRSFPVSPPQRFL